MKDDWMNEPHTVAQGKLLTQNNIDPTGMTKKQAAGHIQKLFSTRRVGDSHLQKSYDRFLQLKKITDGK